MLSQRNSGGRRAALLLCVAALGAAACTSGELRAAQPDATTTTTGTRPQPRPSGPAAAMSGEITGGKGVFIGEGTPTNVRKLGYAEHEYVAAGTATSYKNSGAIRHDGHWSFVPDASAPYRTRVLVRQPADPKAFSGDVVVEWLNVSGGVDANPDWTSLSEEIVRRGDAWVGVSAQRIGVEGGPVLVKVDVPGIEAAGQGLKAIDPARYGTLDHPGDGYSFDIFTQVARAVAAGQGMRGLKPKHVLAAGESQSAFALVTYYNGVQPLTHAFDGFLVHSRGAVGLPLVGPGQYADIAGSLAGTASTFRTDQTAPVLDIQTESDVSSILSSYSARQPDSARFRLWEVAGTAHADKHLIGAKNSSFIDCGVPINDGPMHLVAKAALHALTQWVESGKAPSTAPRITIPAGATPQVSRDADGIALGGIRTPPVAVPAVVLSGVPGPKGSTICILDGSTKPLPAARLEQLYPSRAAYLDRYRAAAAATIKAGFVLPEDRAALLAYARPSGITK